MRRSWRLRFAATGVVVATALAAWAAGRAVRIEPVAAEAVAAADAPPAEAGAHLRAATDPGALIAAAENNPFHPERRRGAPYRLPGEDLPVPASYEPGPDPATVRLVGTAVGGGGADFVVCAADHQPPRIVRVGEPCGALVLEAVERGRAEFVGPDGTRVVLEVPKAGSM